MLRSCSLAFVAVALAAAGCDQGGKAMRSENQAVASASRNPRSVTAVGADGRLTRKSISQVQGRPAGTNPRPDWDWLGVAGDGRKSVATGDVRTARAAQKPPELDRQGPGGKGQPPKLGSQQVAMGDWLVKPPEKRGQWGHVKVRHDGEHAASPRNSPGLDTFDSVPTSAGRFSSPASAPPAAPPASSPPSAGASD